MISPLILIIEDEKPVRNFLGASLKSQHYKVLYGENGSEGISLAASHNPDLILLDLGLPDIDGIDVIMRIREFSTAPILVLSARGEEQEKVEALDLGADDYLGKPFGTPELLARIRAGIRRKHLAKSNGDGNSPVFTLSTLTVDVEKHLVMIEGREIHVTPTEFKLLSVMVRHPGKVLTHTFLLKEVWGSISASETQSLRVYMANLRRKLEIDPANPRFFRTEVGVGYRIIDE
ncbi:MAG: response regulator [Spirochaetales bacterium]|nr:response regulator [Spirochaetales bacterium]